MHTVYIKAQIMHICYAMGVHRL